MNAALKKPKFSYSNTDTFNTCPVQFQKINWLYTYRSESGPEAERGTAMHEEFEECVLADTDYSMPEYQWVLDRFRGRTGLKIPEMQLAINRDWEPVDYKDKSAWYRGKIDFTCINGTHAYVDDLKTGKRKFKDPKPFERWLIKCHEDGMKEAPKMQANARQASEYALLIFHHFPKIETVDFRFVWSDVDGVKDDLFKFSRKDHGLQLTETMLATPIKIQYAIDNDEWEPKPSGLCQKWCPCVSCEYHGMPYFKIKQRLKKQESKR